MSAIDVQHLRKDYDGVAAVNDLSFRVERGETFALVGPNGAGKTTTVEILEGHRRRTSGSVTVLGYDPQTGGRAYRQRIGIVLQEAGFEDDVTVRELVQLYQGMYPRRLAVDDVIDLVGLGEKADAKVKTLSGGQSRRLDAGRRGHGCAVRDRADRRHLARRGQGMGCAQTGPGPGAAGMGLPGGTSRGRPRVRVRPPQPPRGRVGPAGAADAGVRWAVRTTLRDLMRSSSRSGCPSVSSRSP
jgi:hypothetical protein